MLTNGNGSPLCSYFIELSWLFLFIYYFILDMMF